MPSFVLRSSDALFLEWHMQFTRPHLVHPRAHGLVTPLPRRGVNPVINANLDPGGWSAYSF